MPETIAQASLRIVQENLLASPSLAIPKTVTSNLRHVNYKFDRDPFFPTPFKLSESVTSLWTLVSLFSATLSQERYGVQIDNITIDIKQATLMIMSAFLFQIDGKGLWDPSVQSRTEPLDIGKIQEPYRSLATNIYKTKDSRWFHLHGGLDTTKTLNMLSLPQHRPDLALAESAAKINEIYIEAVGKHDSLWLDVEANENWRQAGTICYTIQEFLGTPHGQAMKSEPLYSVERTCNDVPAASWPQEPDSRNRPLAGIKVIDVSRVVAGPTISKVLALLGADVIRLSSPNLPEPTVLVYDMNLGKRDVSIDLKTPEGKETMRNLVSQGDVVIDGFRPGSLEKLGFGKVVLEEISRRRGKGIVYCRENCYGWKGELAHRSGWQQISDCLTGVSWAQGRFAGLDEPLVPLVPNSDYQTGLVGAIATCQALLRRATEGGFYHVKTSLTQYNLWYVNLGLHDLGTQQRIRDLHPNLNVRHNTLLSVMTEKTAESLRHMAEREGDADFFNASRWAYHENRWGIEGEMGQFLDWTQIIKFENKQGEETPIQLGYDLGSCYPGSDKPEWGR